MLLFRGRRARSIVIVEAEGEEPLFLTARRGAGVPLLFKRSVRITETWVIQ